MFYWKLIKKTNLNWNFKRWDKKFIWKKAALWLKPRKRRGYETVRYKNSNSLGMHGSYTKQLYLLHFSIHQWSLASLHSITFTVSITPSKWIVPSLHLILYRDSLRNSECKKMAIYSVIHFHSPQVRAFYNHFNPLYTYLVVWLFTNYHFPSTSICKII